MAATRILHVASALSADANVESAAGECAAALAGAFDDGAPPDVIFLFVSSHYGSRGQAAAEWLRRDLKPRHVLGCTGAGILGDGKEVEDGPALAVAAARLPGATLKPLHLRDESLPGLDTSPRAWEEALGVPASEAPQFVLLADPFSIRADEVLGGLDFAYPDAVKVGGLASGARARRQNMLFLDDRVHREGMVALALSGPVRLDPLVAQGCRPLGKALKVTRCRKNLLLELDGRKPLEWIAELYAQGSEADQRLIRSALFLGLSLDPFKAETSGSGNWLIRNLLGRDPETEGLAIGALLREGQLVQFHVRDGEAAREDLAAVLRRYSTALLEEGQGDAVPRPPAGALLFSCLGRGRHMYGRSGHDSALMREVLGELPLAGFFCNGEIGPVSGVTHLHGFTSCFGVLRAKG